MRPHVLALFLCTAGWLAFAGCNATPDASPEATAAASGAGGATAGATTGGPGGADFDAGATDGPLGEDAACASSSAVAELVQLDMVILLDRSGSMSQNMKWAGLTDALHAFVTDPASAGIGAGLQLFPNDPDGVSCDYHDYDNLFVIIGELPQNVVGIDSAMQNSVPAGNTPMFGALKGVLLNATAFQDAHPDHHVIVVLATDGEPGGCGEAQDKIPAIAALIQSARDYNGLETYTVAIAGSAVQSLDQLAAAGGTTAAYDVSADISQFSQKMAEIRGTALPCALPLPAPPDGERLDPEHVNVAYTPGGQGAPETIPQADGFVDCGSDPGWYYDDAVDPSNVLLCPASCAVVQADPQAVMKILFGCKTIIN